MNIYSITGSKLTWLKPAGFRLEKDLQKLVEENLKELSELELVKTEFIFKNSRIDTLCYNPRLKAFVIIEYKRGASSSLVDQGIAYLKLLLDSKAEILLTYNEITGRILKRKDVRWRNSYVIFASPSFTPRQLNATMWPELKIILWQVTLFGDSVLAINEMTCQNCEVVNNSADFKVMPPANTQSWMADPLWINIKKIAK
jgi:hypothetical protein